MHRPQRLGLIGVRADLRTVRSMEVTFRTPEHRSQQATKKRNAVLVAGATASVLLSAAGIGGLLPEPGTQTATPAASAPSTTVPVTDATPDQTVDSTVAPVTTEVTQPTVAPTSAPTTTPTPSYGDYLAAVPKQIFGVTLVGRPSDVDQADTISDFGSAAGAEPNVISWNIALTDTLSSEDLATVGSLDATPMVSLDPWSRHRDDDVLGSIIDGRYDDVLTRHAVTVAGYPGPVLIRIARDPNSEGYPWSVTDDTADKFVDAWRHAVEVFRANGADNAEFVFGVGRVELDDVDLEALYPGDDWVDYVGLSGFWPQGHQGKLYADMLFGTTIRDVRDITDKPMFIAETGADRSLWRGTYYRHLTQVGDVYPDVLGWCWVEAQESTGDWRVAIDEDAPLLAEVVTVWNPGTGQRTESEAS